MGNMPADKSAITPNQHRLPVWVKFIYGTGDWGRASFNTLRQIFYAIFLTDVVGLDPRLAGTAALISLIWDAINDPLVGGLSDRFKSRWGRRRPFLLFFTIPFALAFVLMWWAPPWETQLALMAHVTIAYMISDTLQTLVTVPYLALTPELAKDYDSRTSLTGFRMFFNLVASLATAVGAPVILDIAVKAGLTQQQGYLILSALFGGLGALPMFLVFFTIREEQPDSPLVQVTASLKETIRTLWANRPFRSAAAMYILNWVSSDIIALMLPYMLTYWVASGDLLAKVNILGGMALEAVVLGVLMITATLAVPIWSRLAQRFNKRQAYMGSLLFWIVVECLILTIQPGQITYIIILTFLGGLGISAAHVLPESIFPDVIDWDEVRTNSRREGMYYGAVNFLRKLSSAFAIFIALQILGWFGYQAPPEGATIFQQAPQTLLSIRILSGPLVALLLLALLGFTWYYPLTRERQNRIQSLLRRRRERRLKKSDKRQQQIDSVVADNAKIT